jgi:hypothetical protein
MAMKERSRDKPSLSATSVQHFTEAEVRGMVANPIYAGIGPYPQLIPDEQWNRCAVWMASAMLAG